MTAKPWKSSSLFVQSNSYWHAKNRLDMLFEISMYLLTLNMYQRLKPNWISRIVVILNLHTVIHNSLIFKKILENHYFKVNFFLKHKPCCFYFNPQIEIQHVCFDLWGNTNQYIHATHLQTYILFITVKTSNS